MSRVSKDRREKGASRRGSFEWSEVSCGSSSSCPRLYDKDEEELPRCFGRSGAFDPLHVARAYALGGKESEEFPHGTKWAFECVFMMQIDHPQAALEIIRLAAIESQTAAQRAKIGCGHLESLLANHGRTVIDDVERLARAEPNFRECLVHVWQHGMPDDIWRRVLAASGRA
jgi:hypothetical protein